MSRILAAATLGAALLAGTGLALAQTPTSGTTLAGGNNGANAKAAATMKSRMGTMTKGSPNAPVRHGQSTMHPNGKMRASKNF